MMIFPEVDEEGTIAKFLKDIDAEAKRLEPEEKHERTRWTKAIKNVLATIGNELKNVDCYRSDSKSRSREFLLDLVWWDCQKDVALLACESELEKNPVSVGEDFEKLLSFKSPFKLMIFDSRSEPVFHAFIDELDRLGKKYGYHLLGETYWVLDIAEKRRVWKYKIPRDGSNTDFKLAPCPLTQ